MARTSCITTTARSSRSIWPNGKSYNISKQIPAEFVDTEDDHNVVKPPRRPLGWSKDSSAVLLSDGWDIWKAPVHGGAGVNLTGNGKKDKIRYQTSLPSRSG